MCQICDLWNSKKVDSKEAYQLINKKLIESPLYADHLIELSNKIIESEISLSERDVETETLWEKSKIRE